MARHTDHQHQKWAERSVDADAADRAWILPATENTSLDSLIGTQDECMMRTAEPEAPGVTDLQPWQLSPKEVQRICETITDAPLDKSAGPAPGVSLLGRLSAVSCLGGRFRGMRKKTRGGNPDWSAPH